MTLLKIVRNRRIKELQEYLNTNRELVINKQLFINTILNKIPVNGDFINKEAGKIVYPILHHCIERDSAVSEKKERLSFQNVINILDKAVHEFITPKYFHGLINFQDYDGNTLLHQAVINNNTEAIKALLKHDANPLIKNRSQKIPLDLAQENTIEVFIKCMKDQAKSKEESARCNILGGIIPGGFLSVGLGVSGALIPSMTIILCTLAVSALVAGIAVGLAIYFLSQDHKQAESIEKTIDSQLSSLLSMKRLIKMK